MIIHWQWVIAAFLAGITLALCLAIRRRRQIRQTPPVLYLLPMISLLLAAGIGLTGYETTTPQVETAVPIFSPSPSATPTFSTAADKLPLPQISRYEPTAAPAAAMPPPTAEPPQTISRRLHIPALNLHKPIRIIPLENGTWNVAELGSDVGWLETTAAHPDDEQAMVFVGHMTFANDNLLEQGAFADIPTLPYGSSVILETESGSYTYLIDSVRRVSPDNTGVLYQEPGNAILLLTCADWNPNKGVYENRLLVRASREPSTD
jgi:LPXTG-site transpeptidase (sortase) family protein